MELIMQNLDAKKLALMALRKKLRQLEMETSGASPEQASNMDDLSTDEKGFSNQVEDAREEADTIAASEGEDGEKEVSVEMELEGDTGGMEALYKRMREDFGSEPESRKATGKKVSMRGGMSSGMEAMQKVMSKKKK
jgi:hypothetical protein